MNPVRGTSLLSHPAAIHAPHTSPAGGNTGGNTARRREHPSHFKYYLTASGLMELRAAVTLPSSICAGARTPLLYLCRRSLIVCTFASINREHSDHSVMLYERREDT
ncbi:hypothetical protein PBY51_018537 [Eleginops maclovinus]|uniref:Uncharacterized protein n=1 Tax=Eleginops maclovinus TaxID=56733 RepID=A0AAN7Y8D2_ELEMC|nr:hypothetical protein PBY51_018537 [Eleginops maclovinus]